MECFSATVLVLVSVVILVVAQRSQRQARRDAAAAAVRLTVLEGRLAALERRITAASPEPSPAGSPTIPSEAVMATEAPVPAAVPPPPAALPELPEPVPAPAVPATAAMVAPPPPALPPAPRPPAPGLEERLGARLPAWIGSIALALAGAFLVKYSFDQGWLSPPVRIGLGVAFGLVLLGIGFVLRRPADLVAQALSASGIATLFASFLAGVHLYQLISPGTGFVLLAATTALAVGLSLKQGRMIALVGLVGGFLTPLLVRPGEPDVRGLFAYLLLLEIGLVAVARRRGWPEVAALSAGAGLLWAFAWIVLPFRPADSPWLGAFVLLSLGAVVAAGRAGRAGESRARLGLEAAVIPVGLFVLTVLTGRAGYSTTEWLFFGLLAAGTLVLGRLDQALDRLPWVAAGLGVALFGAWALAEPLGETARVRWTALALGALFAGGGYLLGRGARRPAVWTGLVAASALALFLLTYAAEPGAAPAGPWTAVALVLAALSAAAMAPLLRGRAERPDLAAAAVPLAVAATAFAAAAAPIALDGVWVAVAWSLLVPALVWLAGRLDLSVLSWLAAAVAALTAARLLLDPRLLAEPAGPLPLVDPLLPGYGVPALAVAAASVLARAQRRDPLATGLAAGAMVLGGVWIALAVRRLFHPGDVWATDVDLAEGAALAAGWMLYGWALLAAAGRGGRHPETATALDVGGRAAVWLGLAATAAVSLLAANPLWSPQPVGGMPLVNLLLAAYGLPAALLTAAAWQAERGPHRGGLSPGLWLGAAAALGLVLVSLEVRRAFHGSRLDPGGTTAAERWAYSAAWIVYGIALLVAGIARRVRWLRFAALAVMALAVGKVFLFDIARLGGLYRVLSFLGLGASLLFLAWLYQRFVLERSLG